MRTAAEVTASEIREYRRSRQARVARQRSRVEARRAEARSAASVAADLLRRDFGATRILVYGSVARGGDFTEHSDVDLLAWGIPAEREFSAVAACLGVSGEIRVNLAVAESSTTSLLAAAQREGDEL